MNIKRLILNINIYVYICQYGCNNTAHLIHAFLQRDVAIFPPSSVCLPFVTHFNPILSGGSGAAWLPGQGQKRSCSFQRTLLKSWVSYCLLGHSLSEPSRCVVRKANHVEWTGTPLLWSIVSAEPSFPVFSAHVPDLWVKKTPDDSIV